ncbi:putative AAA+ ATPase domain, ATPase, AAA-type, core, AAA-type ATPase domain-containing protein [Helianthus annuus]|nr:putative AAA+ ATPase domain, ATPase, AAA-type, core, AAA-type ATPase domain-containing protein [Helianthus annuus]
MLSPSTKSRFSMAKTVISTVGSVAAAAAVVHTFSRQYLPTEFRREVDNYIHLSLRTVLNNFSNQLTMVFYESEGFGDNEIYTAAQCYLATQIPSDIRRVKVSKNPNEQKFNVGMETNEEYTDLYNGVTFTWSLLSKQKPTGYENGRSLRSEIRSLELTFHRKHKDLVLDSYLPFIINCSKTIIQNEKTVKLFTTDRRWSYSTMLWKSVKLDHPATFETVAMDPSVKEMVLKDLDRFVERREYYRRVGKAWKRGYLLYGPPGTGKSSLIAAIANYLKFDIYDLELTNICSNSELRRLLVATANRSILVVEDIDCSVELHDRVQVETEKEKEKDKAAKKEHKVTLSGFLNFIDGLWSSCGDERIIIFTTNRKEKLDPALVRPGRMDVHIHMSYCTPSVFRMLAFNYLGVTEHDLFEDIDELISHVDVTPAEVAEQLLKDNDPDIALGGLIAFFDVKRKENEEAKAKLKEEEAKLAAIEREKKKLQKKLKKLSAKTSEKKQQEEPATEIEKKQEEKTATEIEKKQQENGVDD